MDVKLSSPVFRALEVLIVGRVRQIDDTECNKPEVSAQMQAERALLLQGLGEMMVSR